MTLQPDKELRHLRTLLIEHYDLDERAKMAISELLNMGWAGQSECYRNIYHLLKDNDAGKWRSGPSGYVSKACE